MNYVNISADQCKGCRVCVQACPNHCLKIGSVFNTMGYQSAVFIGEDRCTACGICFYVCPEPGAVTVFKNEKPQKKRDTGESA